MCFIKEGKAISNGAASSPTLAVLLLAAQGAAAQTLMGNALTSSPTLSYGDLRTYVGISNGGAAPPVTAPVSGLLVAMKIRHGAATGDKPIRFRILSGSVVSGSASFTARAATPDGSLLPTLTVPNGAPAGIATYVPKDSAGNPVGVPIAAGEYLAAVVPGSLQILANVGGPSDAAYISESHDSGLKTYPISAREALIQGVIEPDGDGDRYGDETQDVCPTDATIHLGPCPGSGPPPLAPAITPQPTAKPKAAKKCPKGKKKKKVRGKLKCVQTKPKKKPRQR